MTKRILIMGLPGSGKTTLAEILLQTLVLKGKIVIWFNADQVREKYSDWDFSEEGRIRQSLRMRELADMYAETTDYIICDFVCPLEVMRENYGADITIWMDTIKEGRFADTNSIFDAPKTYDYRITEQNALEIAPRIVDDILT